MVKIVLDGLRAMQQELDMRYLRRLCTLAFFALWITLLVLWLTGRDMPLAVFAAMGVLWVMNLVLWGLGWR
jgi:hypothetical protein